MVLLHDDVNRFGLATRASYRRFVILGSAYLWFLKLFWKFTVSFWAEVSRLYALHKFRTKETCIHSQKCLSIDMAKDLKVPQPFVV